MAQGPPVFPSFQDQRTVPDDNDDGYFADLRAMPDEDDPFGPRRREAAREVPSPGDSYDPRESYRSDDSWQSSPSSRRADSDTYEPRRSVRPADPWAGDEDDDRLSDGWAVPEVDDQPSGGWPVAAPMHAAPQYADQEQPRQRHDGPYRDRPYRDGPYRDGPYRGDPYRDDPYRRSDILVESHTDPTGWKASGPAQPPIPDDRPPAEAISGNRLLTILLFFSGLATSLSLWLFDTQAGAVNDTATLMLAAGRLTGLAAGYLLFIQLLMMSRVSWLEEWVGARDLLRWHRWLGTSLVVGVLAHIVFIVYGYALTGKTGVLDQSWTIVTTFPDMLKAVIATGILVVISLISIRAAKTKLPYEVWYTIHLTGYLVLLLGYGHQVATGADLSGKFASVFWPALTALVISALVWGRLVEPIWLNARHRFEVAEVVEEGTNTFSIYIEGKKLDELPAQAGQFMRWRFLTRNGWWQSHPFSLSAAPNKEWLRLTVTAVGGHTARLGQMKPGTPVWAEGPFGTFTAQRRTRRRALLIAGGSGIAPIRALLEDMPADTIVIYRASRPDELVFRGELEELAERRDAWVRYIVGSRNDPGPRRLFTPDGLLGLVPDVSRRDVYLCGPPGLVDAAVGTLRDLDVPDSQLHLDPFEF
jgi:predicted ferric reductase